MERIHEYTNERVTRGRPWRWVGNGFHVYPVFHNKAFTKELSPWLMFDYAAPKEFNPGYERRGVGQHPHRGFETITIAFQVRGRTDVNVMTNRAPPPPPPCPLKSSS